MYIPNIRKSLNKGVEIVVDGRCGRERECLFGELDRPGY